MILFKIFILKIAQWGTGLVLWSYEGKYQSFNPHYPIMPYAIDNNR
jgi:hypothetical protein